MNHDHDRQLGCEPEGRLKDWEGLGSPAAKQETACCTYFSLQEGDVKSNLRG